MINLTCRAGFFGLVTLIFMTACSDTNQTKDQPVEVSQGDLVGCYSIEKGVPAQIWVHRQTSGLVMQMKESASADSTWDLPEPLNELDLKSGWAYFQSNALDLSQKDLVSVVARPDGVLAIGRLKAAAANTNPYLDSHYVVNLLGAVNTIYQVDCDDVRVDLSGGFHGGQDAQSK